MCMVRNRGQLAPSSLELHDKDGLLVHTFCHPPPQLTNFRKPWPPLIRAPGLKTRDALPVLEYEKRISVLSPVGSQIEVSKDGPVYKSYKGRYSSYPMGLLTMSQIPIRLHLQSAAGMSSWSLALSDASAKRENTWVWLAKGIMNRKEAPLWFQYHHLHLFLAWKEQTLKSFITQRPGLETARCLYHDNIWTSPPSSASKQKLSQGQSSLQGILWIKKKKQTIIKKTILQLRSPLLEAPPARKALRFSQLSSCCFAGR